jgi:ubiquitin carboxyl-terminal hydrolase 14
VGCLILQRKVKFPTEFDALDLVTDDLKEKLIPLSRRLKEIEKERAERRKVRKRTKVVAASTSTSSTAATAGSADVEMGDASGSATATATAITAEAPTAEGAGPEEGKGKEKAGGELEDESVYRENELKELEALISPEVKADVGCSVTGLYDLVG